ncbi:Ribonuclease H1 [Yarrowia sp. B02]|nr:Ribonuclease H1 [Yarrowia sp. B02]
MKNYYAVRVGYHTGIYSNVEDALQEIRGYSYAEWKGFDHYEDAQEYIEESSESSDDETDAHFWVHKDRIFNDRETAYQNSDGQYCESFEDFQDAKSEVLDTYDHHFYYSREDLSYQDDEGNTIYEVYTDGACVRNGQVDAIAGIGVYFGAHNPCNISERLRGELQTNQRAELSAIKKAYQIIASLGDGARYEIYSDSLYAINCLTKWKHSWQKNGWRTCKGNEVANQDLIKSILELMETEGCEKVMGPTKVPAHSDCRGNNEADELARNACEV